jgi:hypothetical protein
MKLDWFYFRDVYIKSRKIPSNFSTPNNGDSILTHWHKSVIIVPSYLNVEKFVKD